MLDLTGIERFFEIRWFDGRTIWLRKPSEEMMLKVANVDLDNMSDEDAMGIIREEVISALENNVGGDDVSADYDRLDVVTCAMIFKGWMEEVEKRLGE